MINIKTLKKFKDGLITHQILSEDSKLEEPLYIDANYTYTSDALNIVDGIVYFYVNDYKDLVFEIINNFKPINSTDVGGISVIEGNRIHNLYEYENNEENIEYKYIRVTKIINTFYGEGGDDAGIWHDKGTRRLANAELIGITYEDQQNFFPINEIKIYKYPSWYIFGLNEGYTIKIYNDNNELLHDIFVDRMESVRITDILYPCNRKILIWNDENVKILDETLEDIWGGDEYYTGIDIDLYNENRELLQLEESKHLGTIKSSQSLRKLIYIVNNSNADIVAHVRIMVESPAYQWVELEYLGTMDKEILVPLNGLGEDEFYIIITQPGNDDTVPTDYISGQDYLFYLEVL